jgi:hypothetical protein
MSVRADLFLCDSWMLRASDYRRYRSTSSVNGGVQDLCAELADMDSFFLRDIRVCEQVRSKWSDHVGSSITCTIMQEDNTDVAGLLSDPNKNVSYLE